MSTQMLSNIELETGWMSTSASQIFLMQLGFLCFEVGYVEPMWTKSIIIKNIEDTFIGALTFVMIGFSLTTGATYFGIIGTIDNIMLLGVPRHMHEIVFINTCYATTCATIISGAVLERMKNIAYLTYTFLVVFVNYSFASCWVWNEEGFLHQLGVVDCAGAFVVHGVGGIAGFIAVYYLGPRRGSLVSEHQDESKYNYNLFDTDNNETTKYKLIPPHEAKQPILMVIGTFILWYGWFAFNVTSPLVANLDVGDNLEQGGLNTFLAPCCSAFTCLIYCKFKNKGTHELIEFEDLVSCIIAGLVAITASCYTVNYWAACIIGIITVPIYFLTNYIVRNKLYIDDPLRISSVHLTPGFFGLFLEGIFADGTVGEPGLVYGGYKHFGYQTFAVVIGFILQILISIIVWKLLLEWLFMKMIYRNEGIRISTLDTYLGIGYFDIDTKSALKDMLLCQNLTAKSMLLSFKHLCDEYGKTYQLDFLVCITKLRKLYLTKGKVKNLQTIYNLYCKSNAKKNINIVPNEQEVIKTLLSSNQANHKAYNLAYQCIFDGLHHFVKDFLHNYADNKYKIDIKLKDKYLPFKIDPLWNVKWMTDPIPMTSEQKNKIEKLRIINKEHIHKLSHDSYLDYTNSLNSNVTNDNNGKTNMININMDTMKENEKEKNIDNNNEENELDETYDQVGDDDSMISHVELQVVVSSRL